MKKEMIAELNKVLKDMGGSVTHLYFSEFLIQ